MEEIDCERRAGVSPSEDRGPAPLRSEESKGGRAEFSKRQGLGRLWSLGARALQFEVLVGGAYWVHEESVVGFFKGFVDADF